MKIKVIDDIRSKTLEELLSELAAAKRTLFNLRFARTSGKATDFSQFRKTRMRIAQILTIIAEKKRGK